MAGLSSVIERQGATERLATEIARADLKLRAGRVRGAVDRVAVRVRRGVDHPGLRLPGPAASIHAGRRVRRSACWLPALSTCDTPAAGGSSRFATQLPDTITLLANSLRAGSSFLQGMELVTREGRPPISEEFERVVREMSLGVALQPALDNLVRRVDVRGPGADGHRHQHPEPGRWQPGHGAGLDRLHHPRARPDHGRDQDADRHAALQRLRHHPAAGRPGAASCSSSARPTWGGCSSNPPEILGLPAGVVFFILGGISMAIG